MYGFSNVGNNRILQYYIQMSQILATLFHFLKIISTFLW